MYKWDEFDVKDANSFVPKPLPAKTRKIEVWCSSIADPGDDFTEYHYLDGRGKVLAKTRVKGW